MNQPLQMPKHTCAVCEREIGLDYLMCLTHWRQVPQPIARRVWSTWRSWQSCDHLPLRMRQQRHDAYLKARQEAIDSINTGAQPT